MQGEFIIRNQINSIQEFIKKNPKFIVGFSQKPENNNKQLCIAIGNKSQLVTLLSAIIQNSSFNVPNLNDYIESLDLSSKGYLVLAND